MKMQFPVILKKHFKYKYYMNELIHDYNGRDYRTVWKHARARFEDFFETRVAKKLLPKFDGWFIDIGGGYGRSYPLYKKEGRKVVIMDYAMNLLEMADESYKDDPNIFFVAADAYHQPFKENTFSSGISIRVMHHMNLAANFLKEINRIMTPGGEFVMDYANKANLFRLLAKPSKTKMVDHEEYEPLLFGTHPAYFKDVSEKSGFRYIRSLGTGFFPRFIGESTKFLGAVLFIPELILDATLGKFNFGPRTVALIKKQGELKTDLQNMGDVKSILCCPLCHGDIDFGVERCTCKGCNKVFAMKGRIFDFRKPL
jgi:ubiquinone/menaquinone biosynthesis C-methylase UbiE